VGFRVELVSFEEMDIYAGRMEATMRFQLLCRGARYARSTRHRSTAVYCADAWCSNSSTVLPCGPFVGVQGT